MEPSFSPGQIAATKTLASGARFVCLFGGARSGKTFLIVRAIILRALKAPGSRHLIARFRQNAVWTSIVGDANATLFVVVDRCFNQPLLEAWEKDKAAAARLGRAPPPRPQLLELASHRQDGYFELPNGSTIWLGGLDDKERVDKILGREYSTVYLNEASEIPYSSILIALTRLAEVRPEIEQRAYIDLNPVGKTHWTNRMFNECRDPTSLHPHPNPAQFNCARLNPKDNIHNLSVEFIAYLDTLPPKQRKRFFEGEYVDEVEGALWTYDNIERNRRTTEDIQGIHFKRVVVGVDPSGAANKDDKRSDEIGIVVAGLSFDSHAFILADRTLRAGPAEWARIAVNAYREFSADRIVAEDNFGGAMVAQTIREIDRTVPVRRVHASRGKAVRAEPISARYALNEVHHVGRFPELEDQLCAFSPAGYEGPNSPDRADALVWALTDLMGEQVISFHIPVVASRPIQVPG